MAEVEEVERRCGQEAAESRLRKLKVSRHTLPCLGEG